MISHYPGFLSDVLNVLVTRFTNQNIRNLETKMFIHNISLEQVILPLCLLSPNSLMEQVFGVKGQLGAAVSRAAA